MKLHYVPISSSQICIVHATFCPFHRSLQQKQMLGKFSLTGFEKSNDARGQKKDLDYLSICNTQQERRTTLTWAKKKTWSAYTSHSGSNFNLHRLLLAPRAPKRSNSDSKLPTRPPSCRFISQISCRLSNSWMLKGLRGWSSSKLLETRRRGEERVGDVKLPRWLVEISAVSWQVIKTVYL